MPGDDFPRLYDAHLQFFEDDLSLWRRLARACGGPILELGCGTGRVLLSLAREGFEVAGLDRDPGMLDRAAGHLAGEPGLQVRLHLGDLREFRLTARYPLILAPCNTLAGLAVHELVAALTTARRHLAQAGCLAAELPVADDRQDLVGDEPIDVFEDAQDGHAIQLYARQTWHDNPARLQVEWAYDELLPDGRVLRTLVPAVYFLRTPEVMADLLHQAGFESIALYGDYDLSPLRPDSPRLLLLAGLGAVPPLQEGKP